MYLIQRQGPCHARMSRALKSTTCNNCVSTDRKTVCAWLAHARVWNIDYANRPWHKQSPFDLKTHVTVAEIKLLISSCYCYFRESGTCMQEASDMVAKVTAITTRSTIFHSKTHRTIHRINRTFTTLPVTDLTRSLAPTQLRSTTFHHHLRRFIIQENRACQTLQARDKATKPTAITIRLLPFRYSLLFNRQSQRIRERRKQRTTYTKETPGRN